MTRRDDTPQKPALARKAEARAARARRLAEALRANLKRRKEQSHGRGDEPREAPSNGDADN